VTWHRETLAARPAIHTPRLSPSADPGVLSFCARIRFWDEHARRCWSAATASSITLSERHEAAGSESATDDLYTTSSARGRGWRRAYALRARAPAGREKIRGRKSRLRKTGDIYAAFLHGLPDFAHESAADPLRDLLLTGHHHSLTCLQMYHHRLRPARYHAVVSRAGDGNFHAIDG